MPKNPVFDLARGKASPELVERLFNSPGAYWEGDEFWTLNPTRGDSKVGSFSINGRNGMWSDFAGGSGDLIDLIVDSGKAPTKVAAAEMIVLSEGGTLPESSYTQPAQKKADKKDRPEPVMPIPESEIPNLQTRVTGKWAQDNRGTAVKTWAWRRADGSMWVTTTRYNFWKRGADRRIIATPEGEQELDKDVIAHYFAVDGKWHEGNPMESGRHLFRLDQISLADSGTKIIIVEGEKCANVKLPGYMLTTWIGGGKAWQKTDWSPLERFALAGNVIIWPDADNQLDKDCKTILPWDDQPGQKTSLGIMRRLPGSVIMDTSDKAAIKNGWDIADAESDGIDIPAYIESCTKTGAPLPPQAGAVKSDKGLPFICIGYDKSTYYFIRKDTRTIFTINMGSFNPSKIGELAPLSWWSIMGLVGDQGTIKSALAQDYLISLQHKAGFYDPKKIRGAGVWRDQDGIILNDGSRIITMDGKSYTYDEYESTYYYVPSLVSFGEMHGAVSTDQDGRQLEELFKALEFEELSQAVLLMGWCLIAPFGGVLSWRPHVWLTGKAGSGKSWAMDNIVLPLCGPFAYKGSGKDTEAGIRRYLDNDARPAIMLEVEPKNKSAREKIISILEMARNASDDSGLIHMGAPGGGVQSFHIRSMFAFSSKVMPVDDDSVSSRITCLELVKSKNEAAKIEKCVGIVEDLMDDPGRFTRRIFHALPRIIADIEYLKENYLAAFRSKRAADQVAPMLAVSWAAQSDKSIRYAGMWLDRWLIELSQESKVTTADEDTFMDHFVSLGLKTDSMKVRSISELLERVADDKDEHKEALDVLERYGVTLRRNYDYKWVLSIATNSRPLAELFRDTSWGESYGSQIKRNTCAQEGKTRQVRMKLGKPRCHDLDWELFREKYIGREGTDEPSLFVNKSDDIPF